VPWQLAEAEKAGDADVATIEHLERRLLTVTAQHKDLQDKVGHQLLPLSQARLLPHLRCYSVK
jgi:methyl coenzyme M reductase subunit D